MTNGFTTSEVGKLLGRCNKTIHNMVSAGELEAQKEKDGTLRFSVDAMLDYYRRRMAQNTCIAPRHIAPQDTSLHINNAMSQNVKRGGNEAKSWS